MNKEFVKFILKLFILFIVIWIIFAVIAKNFGMFIYDEEYASYKETLDYVRNDTKDSQILVFGDSVAKSAVMPELIPKETYNISMAGASPIVQYYLMQDYLEKHEPPETMIMIYFMGGYNQIADFFWNRTVYFNCLSTEQFKDILSTEVFPEENAMFKFMQYKLCMPNRYYAPIKNALLENRYEINEKEYKNSKKNKGQHVFGTLEAYAPDNVAVTRQEHFDVLEIVDLYMNKCIQLCEENGIQVIIEQHPINLSTFVNLKEDFKIEYIDYMENLQAKYPNAIVNTEICIADDNWFGDFAHTNENGAIQFTEMLLEKYKEYLK